jgi:hypothetical protein
MWERKVAPLSGVAAAVLIVGSALIINNYQFMPPAEDVADFYQTNPGTHHGGCLHRDTCRLLHALVCR